MMFKNLKQGFYKPQYPEKYEGNIDNIVYRSGLELKYFKFCDSNKNILKWNSEEVIVPYISVDSREHRYFLDLWMRVITKTGNIQEYICEIKPLIFLKPPQNPKRRTKQWTAKYKTWLINQSKWSSAKKYADQKGWKFIILTEKDIK